MTTTPILTNDRPACPECGTIMSKRGKRWSGRHKKQLWLCFGCGRTKILPLSDNGSSPTATQNKTRVKPPEDNHHRLCPHKCAYNPNQDGYCIRKSYMFACPFEEPEWNELIARQRG